MGNLCADPELKKTPSGVSVCTFRIGVQRRYKDGDGNSVSDFFTVVAWRQTAEFVCKYFKKGASMIVFGALSSRDYTDRTGDKRQIVEVVADEVLFGGTKSAGVSVPAPSDTDAPPTFGVPAQDDRAKTQTPNMEPLSAGDDLPF